MKKESHSAEGDIPQPKKMYDPVLTWVLNRASQGETEESPRTSGEMDGRNAESDANIFKFPSPERAPDETGGGAGVFSDYGRIKS